MITVLKIPFELVSWSHIEATEHCGKTGKAYCKTIQLEGFRICMVDYSAEYKAAHWCYKGHVLYCISGKMIIEFEDGSCYILREGMSYYVSASDIGHRNLTKNGAQVFIVEGDFLNADPIKNLQQKCRKI